MSDFDTLMSENEQFGLFTLGIETLSAYRAFSRMEPFTVFK